jgi:glutamate dehydrogenase
MNLRQAAGTGLTRPELAVLLAWSKIVLIDDVVASDIPDDPYFDSVLKSYFTKPIDAFEDAIGNHRLKREIIATVIANRSLDMAGPVPLLRLREMTGADNAAIVRGLEASRAVLDFDAFRREVDGLDTKVGADVQIDMRIQAMQAMNEAASWYVRNMPGRTVGEAVAQTHAPLNEFKTALGEVHAPFPAARIERAARAFVKRGAPDALARWTAVMSHFSQGLVVIDLARAASVDVPGAGAAFYAIGDALRLDRLRASAREGLAKAGYWDRIAGRRLVSELVRIQAAAAQEALAGGGVDAWLAERAETRRQLISTLGTLTKGKDWSFAKFTLSADAVRQFMGR